MSVKVVDASAIGALLFNELPAADEIAPLLVDSALTAPTLITYEIGNICWKKCRKQRALTSAFRASLLSLKEMDLQLLDVDPVQTLELAGEGDISYYDASYLWLARELDAPLITLDRKLARLGQSRRKP